MFNQTLTSAIQTMSPLWSEQIVKNVGLDVRYVTALNMIFNGLSTAFNLDNVTAMYIVMSIMMAFTGYYINKYTNGLLIRLVNRLTSVSLVNSGKKITITHSMCSALFLEEYLYENQIYVNNASWMFNNGCITTGGYGSMQINNHYAFLQEGSYEINISDELHFNLAVIPADKGTRTYQLKFYKGSEQQLIDIINIYQKSKDVTVATSTARDLSYWNIRNEHSTCFTMGVCTKQYDRSVFDGYYHPQLETIINWIDALNKPAQFNQPQQISLMCYGESGSGKSTLARRIAQYTSRSILSVDLLTFKKKYQLEELFLKALTTDHIFGIKNVIIELDEFDKTVKVLNLLKEKKKYNDKIALSELQYYMWPPETYKSKNPEDNDKDNKTEQTKTDSKKKCFDSNPYEDIEWDLDDLLKIFCGSYVPDGRIIVSSGNSRELIDRLCPYLLRAGRMTPIHYTNGDKHLLQQITKDYAGVTVDITDIPDSYRFVQASLIEYLRSNSGHISEEHILAKLAYFASKAISTGPEKNDADSDRSTTDSDF